MIFKMGELFCGPGGIALGATKAGFTHKKERYAIEHAWANDYDRDTCATFAFNICGGIDSTVYCADVRSFNLSNLSPIDAFSFGFPCNDFSIVGEQKGIDGTYGPLYTYGIKVLKKYQPKFFLAENVGGIRSSNEGKTFGKILSAMLDSGYEITPHIYKFEKYGVPQNRHRVIIIGIRNDLDVRFHVPAPTTEKSQISARIAIEIPAIPNDAQNNELTRQSANVIRRLMHIRPGENAFNATLPKELQLNVNGAKISQIYKRLHPDKPSYTITGSGGGGTHVYHWSEHRALTNRERARLQTFPDEFVFKGSKESVRKQIGMAVPPKGVEVIFNAVLKSFAGIKYESIEPNIDLNVFL
jgi:DNA (cytosine-5)-methyltransferase 1